MWAPAAAASSIATGAGMAAWSLASTNDDFATEIVREVRRQPADQHVGVLLAIVEYADAYRAVDARQHRPRVRLEESGREIRTDDLHRVPSFIRRAAG